MTDSFTLSWRSALEVNAFGVLSLARAAAAIDATLVHYGTDFVFDGTASEPYREEDAPNPQSVYAASKLLGEWFAQGVRHYELRVESLFGGGVNGPRTDGRRPGSSLDRIADALLEGREVWAFGDRVVSPSYVEDVAAATVSLLRAAPAQGLYHCVSGPGTPPGSTWRRRWRGSWAWSPSSAASPWTSWSCALRAPASARCRTASSPRPGWRCRTGGTRSRVTPVSGCASDPARRQYR